MQTILLVDDEKNMLNVLSMLFEHRGYNVLCAEHGKRALEIYETQPSVDLIISDGKMPQMDGLALLREIRLRDPKLPFILITAYGSIDGAVEAMKSGASDFITKPFNKELILHTVEKVGSFARMQKENSALRENQKEHNLVFRSGKMRELMEVLSKVARFPTPILLTGESGSGKEVIARAIHKIFQGDETLPFVSINCPAVPESLMESELFGYKKGAFTGADKDFPGKLRMAQGGTIFLDEIGDLPLSIQPKLLRFLENKTVEPLGTGRSVPIETRIVCATNKNLEELVSLGQFRGDLLYRINTFHIELPPLRDRSEDVRPLLDYFLEKYSRDLKLERRYFSEHALAILDAYQWPGNVRELRNIVERSVILSSGTCIEKELLPEALRVGALRNMRYPASSADAEHPLRHAEEQSSSLPDVERRILLDALDRLDGNISAAARELGITRNTMRYRLKKYGLMSGSYAP